MTPAELIAGLHPHALTYSVITSTESASGEAGETPLGRGPRRGATPTPTIPDKSVHCAVAPGDTTPGDIEPGDTEPGDTAPGDTAPGDTAPDEAGPRLWRPPQRDKLFWCFYCLHWGELAYASACDREYAVEREVKINAVELLRSRKGEIAGTGFKLAEVEEELVHARRISSRGLCGLCAAYGVRVLYQLGRTYMILPSQGECDGTIVVRDGCAGLSRSDKEDVAQAEMCKGLYHIANVAKPIRAISAYTLQDLVDIARRLEVPTVGGNGKPLLKKALYSDVRARVLEN